MKRQTMCGIAFALCSIVTTSALAVTGVGPNLIVNGDAEASTGASSFSTILPPSGWTTTGSMTAVLYSLGASSELNTADSLAVNGGLNYFAGGNTALGTAAQSVNVTGMPAQLGSGPIWFRLAGRLGGFSSQGDNAKLTVTFNTTETTIGPVSASDRANDSVLLWRAAFGIIPAGTTAGQLLLTATRFAGTYNDGYADNLALQFTAEPGDATLNHQVNFDDLLLVAQHYGQSAQTWEAGDFDGDGSVLFEDLLLIAQHYGSGSVLGADANVATLSSLGRSFASDWAIARSLVPEPSALALFATGSALMRRRIASR